MVLSYVHRRGHLSVLISLDLVLIVANGAYGCHSVILSLFFFSLMCRYQGIILEET